MKAAKVSAALAAAVAVSLMVFVGLVAASGDDIILRGPVTAVSPTSISVQTAGGEKTADITAGTEIFIGDSNLGVHGTVDDIEVGADVKVKAHQGVSSVVADEIEIETDSTVTPTPTVDPTVTPTSTPDDGDEVEFGGIIADIRTGEVDVVAADGTKTVHVTDSTVVRESGVLKTLADLAVGQTLEVKGHVDGDSIVADRITIEHEDDPGDEDEFQATGSVTEVGDASVTIDTGGRSMTFVVTADTRIDAERDQSSSDPGASGADAGNGSLPDVKPGQMVRIDGRRQGDDLIAEEIRILNDEFKDLAVEGTITALDPGTIAVDTADGPKTFGINSNTEVEHQNGDDASPADLAIDQDVLVAAEDDAVDVAHHITILDGVARPHSAEQEISGQVMSVDPGAMSFVVKQGSTSTTVLAGTGVEIKNADGSDGGFESIAVGLFVKVHGMPVDAGFAANEIELFNESHEAGVVKAVTSTGGSLRLVVRAGGHRRVVLVDDGTHIERSDGKKLTAASLKIGTVVFVQASGRRVLDASRVVVEAKRSGVVRIAGTVASRVTSVLRVKTARRIVALKLRPGTVLLLRNGRPFSATALKVGTRVTVLGYATAAGRIITMVRVGG